ncbi:sodium/glutamate symporter, partial [Vibrio parahaemolyticus]
LQPCLLKIYSNMVVLWGNYEGIPQGFGMGATPTAIANMQTVTKAFGPSHKAFLVVPMVGAFIVDISNSILIKIFIEIGTYFT